MYVLVCQCGRMSMYFSVPQGSVWICMEVMDASLERFYQTVFAGGAGVRMPEEVIGAVASSVSPLLFFSFSFLVT